MTTGRIGVLGYAEIDSIRDDWRQFVGASGSLDTIHPEWLEHESARLGTEAVSVIVARDGAQFAGLMPVARSRIPLRYGIGYKRAIATASLRSLDVQCPTLFARDEATGESLVRALYEMSCDADVDAINFGRVIVDSPMWRAVHSSAVIGARMWLHRSERETRRLIAMGASFDEYARHRLSRKTRGTLRRMRNRLERACNGGLALHCLEAPTDVPRCLEWLQTVRRKSWQGHFVNDEGHNDLARLNTLASHGWLRCYFLHSGHEPISYVLGRQQEGVFHYDQLGYDQRWADYSVGTVLLVMVLEDLFGRNDTPRIFDFEHGDTDYKRRFSTDAVDVATLWAVRRSPANALVYGSYRLFEQGVATARHAMDRVGVLQKVRSVRRTVRDAAVRRNLSNDRPSSANV